MFSKDNAQVCALCEHGTQLQNVNHVLCRKKASFWPHTDAVNLPMIRSNANPSAFPCSTADIRRRTFPLPENTAAPLPAAWPESARKTEEENSLCLFRIQEVRGESGGVQRCQTGRHAQAGRRRGCVKARRSCGAGAAAPRRPGGADQCGAHGGCSGGPAYRSRREPRCAPQCVSERHGGR